MHGPHPSHVIAPADQDTRRKVSSPMAKSAQRASASDAKQDSVMESKDSTPSRDPARDSALGRAVQQIEKQFGKGAVMRLDGERRATIDGIPTGSLSLDIALGGSGV